MKEEVKNNKDEILGRLLDGETKISKLLTDLEHEKHNALYDITALGSKLIKLEISPAQIDRIEKFLSSNF